MHHFPVGHLADHVLVRETRALVARERLNTAALLAHLGEIDARRIYAEDYSSMFAWCLGELRLSEDSAGKRLTVARCARKFPAVLGAVADGRLHLSAVGLLATHLTPANCDELAAMATHRSKSEIEHLLAARFPRPDVPTVLRPVASPAPATSQDGFVAAIECAPTDEHTQAPLPQHPGEHAPGRVEVREVSGTSGANGSPAGGETPAPGITTVLPVRPYLRLTPLSPDRYEFRGTIDRETRDLLLEAQALLGHAVPAGNLAEILKRALQDLVTRLGKRRGAVARRAVTPRGAAGSAQPKRRLVANERYIPDRLKNQVWQRDGGRCTHVGPGGRRCDSRTRLELDHVIPIARGGRSTLENLRLRCQAHNRLEAERILGRAFIRGRIRQARGGAREGRRTNAPPAAPA